MGGMGRSPVLLREKALKVIPSQICPWIIFMLHLHRQQTRHSKIYNNGPWTKRFCWSKRTEECYKRNSYVVPEKSTSFAIPLNVIDFMKQVNSKQLANFLLKKAHERGYGNSGLFSRAWSANKRLMSRARGNTHNSITKISLFTLRTWLFPPKKVKSAICIY